MVSFENVRKQGRELQFLKSLIPPSFMQLLTLAPRATSPLSPPRDICNQTKVKGYSRQMRNFLRTTWRQICNMITISPTNKISPRDIAIAVAGRVTIKTEEGCSKVSCPVCLNLFQAKTDSDVRLTLAVHMSLFHPDDVNLQWDIMQKKEQSIVHLPSLVVGIGMAAGFGALLARQVKRRS